jgi:CHAT domain-containing protein
VALATIQEAVRLAQEKQFAPAAAVALECAERSLRTGRRLDAFDFLGAAGKFSHLAGDHAAALAAFGRAFDVFEKDLVHQPRATLVIRRLAAWPELYTRAAVSALELGDPLRAVTLADRGRTRALGHRLGPAAGVPPRNARPELWRSYVSTWRRAVALAASGLLDADGWTRRADAKALDAKLSETRMTLSDDGVASEDLTPLTPVRDAADALALLRDPAAPKTAVLYAIRLDDTVLRFVALTARGAVEVPLPADDQGRILRACDVHAAELRGDPDAIAGRIEELAPALLAETSPRLAPVFERTLADAETDRLLWIPQGSLVGIPVLACAVGDGLLADRAAVLVAPSLALGSAALSPDRRATTGVASLRGRVEDGKASTAGGDALLRAAGWRSPPEVEPRTRAEFDAAVADRALVSVTCHGVRDAKDPLHARLEFGDGFDLSIEDLLESPSFHADALVVLGACDAGTVAQTNVNEALGIPMGLRAAGAHAVVGAAWPIARVAAVVLCLRILRELADGAASPDALRRAAVFARDAPASTIHELLAAAGHPLAALVADVEPTERLLAAPHLWAAYLHWGGGWRARDAKPR